MYYRKLNSFTLEDAESVPRVDSILDKLKSARCFSTLDLVYGYWRIVLHHLDTKNWHLQLIVNYLNDLSYLSKSPLDYQFSIKHVE